MAVRLERLKGVAAITTSLGLLDLAHHALRQPAYALTGHFRINRDAHSIRIGSSITPRY